MTESKIVKDHQASYQQMDIIEKYERVIQYLYPIVQTTNRKHGKARDMFLECLLKQVELLSSAGKSNQVSKLYLADSNLQTLRFWVRFFSSSSVKHLTIKQREESERRISHVGNMLGSWIKSKKGKG